jgi:2-methylaconitate cis-trans-isomerase PrpF
MGSPDIKQIDGIGGTVSSTSKVAVISPSKLPNTDVDYDFFQVDILIPNVDNSANCGNLLAAVGNFAIEEGLVEPKEPETVVRVFNTNTKKIIELHVQVKDGKPCVEGDTHIGGVPGTGAPIDVYFVNPSGSKTGKLFPTGKSMEVLDVPGYPPTEVTIVDCANPNVLIPASALGIKGIELVELNNNKQVMQFIETVRGVAAMKLGFVSKWQDACMESTSIPKVAIISQSQDYVDMDGNHVLAEDFDVCTRAISVGSLHKAIPLTLAAAVGATVKQEGTIIHKIMKKRKNIHRDVIRLGHASGVIEIKVVMDKDTIIKVGVVRTARRIMDGYIYIR